MPSVSVNPPKTPVTKGSNGIATATIPNVCKMPGPPAPFVPAPLPNIGKSGDSPKGYSQDVTIEGKAVAIKGATFNSMGDMASKGTGGGLISANTHGITKFVGPGSMDVKIEGKNVQLLSDPMLNNCAGGGSPPNAATLVGVLQATGLAAVMGDEPCPVCGKTHDDAGKLEETVDTKGEMDKFEKAAKKAVDDFRDKREKLIDDAIDDLHTKNVERFNSAKKALGDQLQAAPEAVKPTIQANYDRLKEPQKSDINREKVAAKIGNGHFEAMLGVVVCKDKKVFAGKAGGGLTPINEALDASWHREGGKGKLPKDRLKKHISISDDVFNTRWEQMEAGNRTWATAVDAAPKTKAGRASVGQPYFPPGQCAAQQCIVLALDHGHRPAGLTERAYNVDDPNYTVMARARESKSSAPQERYFGGTQKDKAGDTEAVPPCGTCQVMVPMLICPDIHKIECGPDTKVKDCGGCS